jgi:hypothetical protein
MSTAPRVYPIDNPETTELWNKVCAAVQRQDLAGDILAMVQKSLDRQAARIEHDALTDMLEKIFEAVTKNIGEDTYDLGGYFMAVGDMVESHFADRLGDDWLVKNASDEDLGLFVWLRSYQDVDPKKLVEQIFSAAEKNEAVDEKARSQCATFIAESFKSILTEARQSIAQATYWNHVVDKMLDELLGEDFFGTEGQRDPRGDRRG